MIPVAFGFWRKVMRLRLTHVIALGALIGCCSLTQIATVRAYPVGSSSAAAPVSLTARTVLRGTSPAGPLLHASHVRLLVGSTPVSFDVELQIPDDAALRAYIAGLSNPTAANYHAYLTPASFAALFGPSLATISTVESTLHDEGFSQVSLLPGHLGFVVHANVAAVNAAFHAAMSEYVLPSGTIVTSNANPLELPSGIAHDVAGIVGLTATPPAKPLLVPGTTSPTGTSSTSQPLTSGPQPCSGASTSGYLTANDIASAYGFDPLYSLGDLGSGTSVGVLEPQVDPNVQSDVNTYLSCYGISTKVNYINVSGTPPTASSPGEETLDIETIAGLAPSTTINVYQGPNTSNALFQEIQDVITNDTDKIISNSWSNGCQLDTYSNNSTLMASEQSLFQEAAAQGQTFLSGSGDTGSLGCWPDTGSPYQSNIDTTDPASQPYVVAVGGTYLTNPGTSQQSESVWNDANGASGGGVAGDVNTSNTYYWPMPSYQSGATIPGIISANSLKCGGSSTYCREVPDVAADASDGSAVAVYLGKWTGLAGTSLATPIWAAAAALIDSSPYCSFYGAGSPGTLPQDLYAVASNSTLYGNSFHDVTSGNNDWSSSGYTTGGLYPATTGYDMATGLGTPVLSHPSYGTPGLAAAICYHAATTNTTPSITGASLSPSSQGTTATYTLTGSGFMTIAGADVVQVNGVGAYPASCNTTTTCTVNLPADVAGASTSLTMSVNGLAASQPYTLSPSGSADITLTASPSSGTSSFPVTLTAAVSGNSGTPTGMVRFYEDGYLLGSIPLSLSGTAQLGVGLLPAQYSSTSFLAQYGGNLTYQGASSPTITVPVNVVGGTTTSATESFVSSLYVTLLGRQPSQSEESYWTNVVASGTSRIAVAATFATSYEYDMDLVNEYYLSYLGRPAALSEREAWANAMLANTLTPEQVQASTLASQEFFNDAGDDNAVFVSRLFQDVLGRYPAPSELQYWVSVLAGGSSRYQVAYSFVRSQEYDNDLVTSWFGQYLHRAPSASEVQYFAGYLQAGTPDATVLASLIGSVEFYGDAASGQQYVNFANYVTSLYTSVLSRTPAASEVQYWTNVLMSGTSMSAVDMSFLTSAEYENDFVNAAYKELLGRNAAPSEQQAWQQQMQLGATYQFIAAAIASSQEFYQDGGGTNAGFVNRLFATILNRAPSSSELSYWTGVVDGGASRLAVAYQFTTSFEANRDFVTGLYGTYLHRTPSTTEVDSWANAITSGLSERNVQVDFLTSAEFVYWSEVKDEG